MTAPGEASEVGSIVAYLSLNRSDWSRGVDETERDSNRLGRLSPNIRIQTNAGEVVGQLALVQAAERKVGTDADKAKPFVVNLWAALAAIAPAAVPIAGVLGGAMVGAIPLVATLALGIAGINDELKSGQLEGTQFGEDLNSVSTEAQKLKQIAAGGLLAGLHTGLAESHGLFEEVNGDVGMMSGQLGDIAGATAPALLRVLTQLNPLFVTFGALVDQGAHRLDDWSKNSDGVSHFVAYVQTEAPQVLSFFGNLITLVAHLAEASAGAGGALLGELSLLVHILNAIPIGVLQATIPVVISLYAAFKTYGAVTAIIAGVNNAINSMKAPFTSTAAVAAAESAVVVRASQSTAQAAADAAVVVARAKAAEAQAAADAAAAMVAPSEGVASLFENEAAAATGAARQITESWEGVASLFATETDQIAESAAAQALAYQAVADAAVLSAEEIAAASVGAADAVATSGRTASVGWVGLLGPLAAVGVGVVLLTSLFGGNKEAAQKNQEIMNGYAQSLKQSANALADVNIQQTAKNLKDQGAIGLADKLKASNTGVALGYDDLTLAVNGTEAQYDSVIRKLGEVADANMHYKHGSDTVKLWNETGHAAIDLSGKLKQLRADFTDEMKVQAELAQINRDAQTAINGGTTATAAQARELGVTVTAYLDAQVAAKKNTDQTNAQALAFRLANDGGSLLALTLDKLSGKKLGYQQALNSFESQLTSGGPKGTPGTPGTPGTGGKVNAASVALATEALTVAQDRYNRAVDKGNAAAVESAQLSLDRAKNALAKAKAGSGGTKGTAGTPGTAADTRLTGMSAAAVQNRGDILSLVTAAESASEAFGKQTGSTEKARQKLVDLRTELINSRVALGEKRADVVKYVDSILTIPPAITNANKTALDVKNDAAKKKIDDLQARINRIKQGKEPHLDANSTEAKGVIADLQAQINALKGQKIPLTVVLSTVVSAKTEAGNKAAQDAYVNSLLQRAGGHAAGTTNAPAGWAWVGEQGPELMRFRGGEQVKSHADSMRAAASGSGGGDRQVTIHKFEQNFHYPYPEEPSRTTSRSMEAAAYVLSDI